MAMATVMVMAMNGWYEDDVVGDMMGIWSVNSDEILYATADATVARCLSLLKSFVLQLLQCNRVFGINPLDPLNFLLSLH